ncbi:MAG: carboxypeptidase regulatory-like domain-containing protein, partial [Gemmatimonadota bacterium]
MHPTPRRSATRRTALGALLLFVHTVGAQPVPRPSASPDPWPLIGRVEGERGEPLVEATIEGAAQRTRTDATGHFQLRATRRDTLTLLLRHVGYEPMAVTLRAEHLRGDTVL